MSSSISSSSLRALEESQKQIIVLIQKLAKFQPSNQVTRSDLSSEIHDLLKDQTDSLELLRQDVDELSRRRVGGAQVTRLREEEEAENDRIVSTFSRLQEDLNMAHRNFRRAQVDAKKAEDIAKRRERVELFARRRRAEDGSLSIGTPAQNLTQDELAINAANDVTKSLRRTHALLESNLDQSQFAMQTLEESSQALAGLSEKYSGMEGLLKTSRGLLGQLYRSQKSDTWYLETAFWILVVTITWLVFRRWLYGPAWWLIYFPLRMLWRTSNMLFSALGLAVSGGWGTSGSTSKAVGTSPAQSRPTFESGMFRSVELGAKGGGWGRAAEQPEQSTSGMVDQINTMIESATAQGTHENRSATSLEPTSVQVASNTKKRTMELEKEQEKSKDE